MTFTSNKIAQIYKLAQAYQDAVFEQFVNPSENQSDPLFAKIIELNNLIKSLAGFVKKVDPTDKDMASLIRRGSALVSDFQTMNLSGSDISQRLHLMQNHLQTIVAINGYTRKQSIYDEEPYMEANTALMQQANKVDAKIVELQGMSKGYQGRSGPVVPKKTAPSVSKPLPAAKPTQKASPGMAYLDGSDSELTSNPELKKSLQELIQGKKRFEVSPRGESMEDLMESLDKTRRQHGGAPEWTAENKY